LKKSRFALLILAVASILVPVGIAQAKVHIKDGSYYKAAKDAKHPAFGVIGTYHGKVTSASFNMKFKDSKGKLCVPAGLSAYAGYVGVSITAKKNVKPTSSGKYKITVKKSTYTPGLTGTVKGKFKSSNKATISAKLKSGNCVGTYSTSSAIYTAGG